MIKHNISGLVKGARKKGRPLMEALKQTPYDDMILIDLTDFSFRMLDHTEDKYYAIYQEGDFDRLFEYTADHFVHPEDVESYRTYIDPKTMKERLAKAGFPGYLECEVRFRATNDAWIRAQLVVISGSLLNESEDVAYYFIYDMQDVVQEDDFSIFATGDPDIHRYEEVTGLLEGVVFWRPAQERIEQFRDGWCLVHIDIKHYKLFVDWYGVESGRYLLSRLAEVLREEERIEGGMAGYMGQDQFCLIVPYDKAKLEALQGKLRKVIAEMTPIEGFIPCFGVAIIDDSCNHIEEFFNRAALTNDELKDNINTTIRVYDPAIHKQNAREYELLFEFQGAIERGEISFYLQPQFRVSNRKIVGAESLARWKRMDGSWISPVIFVPILEKYGLVHKLDVFIWESVCKWCREWLDQGQTLVPISVNVSRQDITSIDVPETFDKLLKKYDLTPENIHIEITETAYSDDFNPVRDTVEVLRSRGFSVMMDDFGSGYSSLSMLRKLNMDVIKLDAQFLRMDREEETKGVSILESIVNMTRNLSTPIIVEGVEDEYQAQFLTELGCAYMQGYYFAHPMPVERFEALIRDGSGIDETGLVFKANQQLTVREFFDENIYSEAVLNNILGPIAFYNQKDDDISIIRYNEQFFEMIGLTEVEMERRIQHIQEYMPLKDHRQLLDILKTAEEHLTLGGHGMVRAIKPNSVYMWLSLHVFFLEEDSRGKKFYVSARDVTDTMFVSEDMPGAYYRTTLDDDFEFLFISDKYQEMTGYTEDEIRIEFDNKQINMVHPADREDLRMWSHEIIEGRDTEARPFRIRRKRGDYIYIAEQDQITDRFGAPCYQTMAIDVTDVMAMRNQMRILSEHLTDTILFVRPVEDRYEFEAVTYNLEDALEMSVSEFEQALNDGIFFSWIVGYEELADKGHLTRSEFIHWYSEEIVGNKRHRLEVNLPSGEIAHMSIRADRVTDAGTRVEYIIMLRSREVTGE